MIEPDTDLALVRLAGECDLSDVGFLTTEIEDSLAGPVPVVVDLGDATFVDAAIVETLIAANERARICGVRLVVLLPFSAAPVVRKVVLELTRAADRLTLAATMTAAVRLAQQPSRKRSAGPDARVPAGVLADRPRVRRAPPEKRRAQSRGSRAARRGPAEPRPAPAVIPVVVNASAHRQLAER